MYLANYVEENRNKDLDVIDTSNIKVYYNPNDLDVPEVVWEWNENNRNFEALKNQWRSKPGRFGIYNFYIHYVYPNGNVTDGIKVGNLNTYKYNLLLGQIVNIDVFNQKIIGYEDYYILLDINSTTNDVINKINKLYEEYYPMTDNILELGVPQAFQVTDGIVEFCNDNKDRLWYNVVAEWESNNPKTINEVVVDDEPTNLIELEGYTNSKGDVLFKMPFDAQANTKKLWFKGIKMYPQFVGYFISYEKPEYIHIGEGLIIPNTKSEKNIVDSGGAVNEINYEYSKDLFTVDSSNKNKQWKFYYPEFNIIGGKTNVTDIYHTGNHNRVSGNSWVNVDTAVGMCYEINDFVGSNEKHEINTNEIISPSTFENINREGYLNLKTDEDITIDQSNKKYKTYTAINKQLDIYLSDTKKLVSLGYTKFQNYNKENPEALYNYGFEDIPYNYDFYRCFSSIMFFRGSGVIINQTTSNHINAFSGEDFYPVDKPIVTEEFYPHIGIIKYWHESHYPLFLKEINQAPDTIFYSHYGTYKSLGGTIGNIVAKVKNANQHQQKSLVLNPQYINNLYKLDPVYYDYTGKLLVNYDDTLVFNKIDFYNKTVRRSDVIQSESIVNSWKYFRPENYKIITENKGDIKNIVGVGNYLFVHCEHSLFLFDITDSLQTIDKNVQLLQPDSFDVNYKEIFTADKGYGGLQDYESWICDEFGYIFYDRSAKKIYRFDAGQLKDLTEGINSFIKTFNPKHIWFGNDRLRNRIMVNIRNGEDDVILSYNLLTDGWSSTHSYKSNYKFIGLKDKLFIANVEGNILTIAHYIDTEFNKFTLPVGNIDNDGSFKSFVDVVFTKPNYNKIKVLDFITYILNKEPSDNFEVLTLEIYTNCCYSGIIDISQERKKVIEYNKPYYDFERWNFNWFRNTIDKIENGDVVDRLSGRIHSYPQKIKKGYDNALMSGKYVVIRFNFKLMSKQVNIKDIHAYFKP